MCNLVASINFQQSVTFVTGSPHSYKKWYISQEYGPIFPFNMTKFPTIPLCIKNFFILLTTNFLHVAKFPGNEITRFHTFSRHGSPIIITQYLNYKLCLQKIIIKFWWFTSSSQMSAGGLSYILPCLMLSTLTLLK